MSSVLVDVNCLQVVEHWGSTIEHTVVRDCENIFVVPHDGSIGAHWDKPSDIDTTSVIESKTFGSDLGKPFQITNQTNTTSI